MNGYIERACNKISNYEYGFDPYASRVTATQLVPATLIMAEYNRDFKGDACKTPRKMTQEQCEENFKNATWYAGLTVNMYSFSLTLRISNNNRAGGVAFGSCFKYTVDFFPKVGGYPILRLLAFILELTYRCR